MRKKNVTFKFRISDEDRDAYLKACEQSGQSASEIIRQFVQTYTEKSSNQSGHHPFERRLRMLTKPVMALGILGATAIAGLVGPLGASSALAEDIELTFEIVIEDIEAGTSVLTVSSYEVRFNNATEFNLLPQNTPDGTAVAYTVDILAEECNRVSGPDCGEGNVSLTFNLSQGGENIGSPSVVVEENGMASLSVNDPTGRNIRLAVNSRPSSE